MSNEIFAIGLLLKYVVVGVTPTNQFLRQRHAAPQTGTNKVKWAITWFASYSSATEREGINEKFTLHPWTVSNLMYTGDC